MSINVPRGAEIAFVVRLVESLSASKFTIELFNFDN